MVKVLILLLIHSFMCPSFSQQILIKDPLKVRKMKKQTLFRNQLPRVLLKGSKDTETANKAHEMMFNITTHYGNANQNHNVIPPHTHEDGYPEK